MFDDLAFEEKINKLLSSIGKLEIEVIEALAANSKKIITSDNLNMVQSTMNEINAIITKHSVYIDKELIEFVQKSTNIYLSTDINTYKEAYKVGMIANDPLIVLTSSKALETLMNEGLNNDRASIKTILDGIKFNANTEINKIFTNTIAAKSINTPNSLLTMDIAKELIANGVSIKDSANRNIHDIVAYARRNVTYYSNQSFSNMQNTLAAEIGIPTSERMIEVSSHHGSRPEHVVFQGRVLPYFDYVRIAKPNTVTGIYGVNCRHKAFEFVKGISQPIFKHYNEAENKKQYDVTQEQRKAERLIRKYKENKIIKEVMGLNVDHEKALISKWQGVARSIVDNNPTAKRHYQREQIA